MMAGFATGVAVFGWGRSRYPANIWYKVCRGVSLGLIGLALLGLAPWVVGGEESPWSSQDAQGNTQIHLYFFWSDTCPHCQDARPFVEGLADRLEWLVLHSENIADEENARRYMDMAASLGQEARSVPAFLFCGQMTVGYGSAQDTGKALEEVLTRCHQSGDITQASNGPNIGAGSLANEALEIPLLGRVDPQNLSLPLYTLVIAGLDAFNPCAFFVLLFLLSLLVHAKSRARILFIGGVFVIFSGLIYFLFMAAWLNLFLWMGELRLITLMAGGLAVFVALVNIKDYFWFRRGLSLSIPDTAKPGLYQRMRGLLRGDSLAPLLLGTVALAIVANSYELLCTAGFPMIYTRILTLAGLSSGEYYLYLAFYNLIYILPLLVIVLIFARTLGGRKLSEAEGRLLKLMSGLMMLGLGTLLLLAPAALNNPLVALGLLVLALGLAWLIHRSAPRQPANPAP